MGRASPYLLVSWLSDLVFLVYSLHPHNHVLVPVTSSSSSAMLSLDDDVLMAVIMMNVMLMEIVDRDYLLKCTSWGATYASFSLHHRLQCQTTI